MKEEQIKEVLKNFKKWKWAGGKDVLKCDKAFAEEFINKPHNKELKQAVELTFQKTQEKKKKQVKLLKATFDEKVSGWDYPIIMDRIDKVFKDVIENANKQNL